MFTKHKPHAGRRKGRKCRFCPRWPWPLTFDLWHWTSNSSERRTKHVFRANLTQFRSAVPEIFHTQTKQELIRRWDSERELLLRRYLTRTSKYSPLLNIQHDAGCRQTKQWRLEWTWPRGITVRRFSHAPICCNEVRFEVILPEFHLTTGEFLTLTPSLGVIDCEYRHT